MILFIESLRPSNSLLRYTTKNIPVKAQKGLIIDELVNTYETEQNMKAISVRIAAVATRDGDRGLSYIRISIPITKNVKLYIASSIQKVDHPEEITTIEIRKEHIPILQRLDLLRNNPAAD